MDLHTLELGDHGSRLVFLHGLFGQGRNWLGIGKSLADRHRVTLVDLPDHGRSPWTERFDYEAIAADVAGLLDRTDPVTLIGHSMGGKVAMLTALLHPELVGRLVVVDMSPVLYDQSPGDIGRYAQAMNAMDLTTVGSRSDADQILTAATQSQTIRSFLLQNLRRDSGPSGWRWQANLPLLERDLPLIADWPDGRLAAVPPYDGPVLWIAGGRSEYVQPAYAGAMDRWFPKNRKVVIKQAGHWVHSEQPEIFTEIVRRFADV